jgi:hypothetical protein
MKPFLLIGTHYHPGGADAIRRQHAARESLLAIEGVHLVNLQFFDGPKTEAVGFETLAAMRNDSCKASGRAGTRKPIGNEVFGLLADRARERGLPFFAWVNSDITMTQAAVDRAARGDKQAYIFSRMNFSGATGEDLGMFVGGQDLFVFRTDWWMKNKRRFRPYVNSEAFWDPIYTTKTLCHADAILLNRTGLIRHEDHAKVWTASPFADYNRYLASLDTLYFFIWDKYKRRLYDLRAAGASEADEMTLQRASFRFHPSLTARLRHAGRCVKAWLRLKRQNWRSR